MAAAAVLLGAALTTFIIVNNKKIEPVELATNDNQVKPAETPVKTETPVSTQATGAGDASTSIASTSTTDTKIRKTEAAKVKQQNTTINDQNVSKIQEEAAMKSMAKGNVNNLPTPDQNPNVDAYAELKGNTAIQQNTPDKNDLTTSPVKAVNTPVTNPVSYASLQSKNSDASDDAEEFETDGKKKQAPWFFQKSYPDLREKDQHQCH